MIHQKKLIKDIENYAETVVLPDQQATDLFRHALIDTITNTVSIRENGEVFVATGDIPAMWLRDSTFQVFPYLSIVQQVPEVNELIHGVLRQQLSYIRLDPYANAFNQESDGGHYSQDTSNIPISPFVWERKFEIDSLCAPFFLAYHLYQTGFKQHLTDEFWEVVELVIDTFIQEQHHDTSTYFFQRTDCPPSDTLPRQGRGTEIGYTGMVWSGFRPSDDACQYGYFIPGNMFIIVVTTQLLDILNVEKNRPTLQEKLHRLRNDIINGIEKYGVMIDHEGKKYYAYEVDGLGNQLFMDDANVPSLLSAPFLGYCSETDPMYLTTRKKVLSTENPFYYAGAYLKGIGSPHTPPNYVWPISLAMEGLTTTDLEIVKNKINSIATTEGGTLQCHEGIDVNNPKNYTREWFSWANMTYCLLVFHYLTLTNKI